MAPVRSQTADEVARIRAQQALDPFFAEVEAQRQAAERRSAQAQADAMARAQLVADYNKSVAPQVEQAYGGAADRTAAFGKGYADGQRIVEQQSAGQSNDLLALHGSPQRVGGPSSGDVLYGLGGAMPGGTLAREGAAFTAAAAQLPATAMGVGQQNAAGIQRDLLNLQADFDAQRRKIEAERPKLIADEKTTIFERNLARQKFAEDKRQAKRNAAIQWASVQGSLASLGLDRAELLQAKAEYMTDATGELHVVKKGKVVPTGKGAPGSQAYGNLNEGAATPKDRAKARTDAVKAKNDALLSTAKSVKEQAQDWLGTPIENPTAENEFVTTNPGKYLMPNGKGTDDVNKAAREGRLTYAQAFKRVMASEEVQQLMSRYGLSRSQARAKVRAWLAAAGIRPAAGKPKPTRRRDDLGKPRAG